MKTIEILKNKLEKITNDFYILLEENKRLKTELYNLQNKNDILNRKSEDLILTINSRLKKEENN